MDLTVFFPRNLLRSFWVHQVEEGSRASVMSQWSGHQSIADGTSDLIRQLTNVRIPCMPSCHPRRFVPRSDPRDGPRSPALGVGTPREPRTIVAMGGRQCILAGHCMAEKFCGGVVMKATLRKPSRWKLTVVTFALCFLPRLGEWSSTTGVRSPTLAA